MIRNVKRYSISTSVSAATCSQPVLSLPVPQDQKEETERTSPVLPKTVPTSHLTMARPVLEQKLPAISGKFVYFVLSGLGSFFDKPFLIDPYPDVTAEPFDQVTG